MAVTNFSPLLGFALPTTGDLSGTWGVTVNDSITSLIDSAVAGTTTLSADADVTLSTTNGAANQARNAVILWTASNGATTRNVTAPAQSKAYVVINAGTGSVVIRGSGPTTGVTVTSGTKALVAWNGSDFVKIASTLINLASDVTGTLPIANGGTGTTSTTFANLTTNVTGTLPIANGGTGNTTIPALSIPVANVLDTFTSVTPSAGQSVRINSGGTAWEAYTPGSGAGSVTTVSVVSANGLAGTVADPTTTPAITLSTSITGVLKGNGTAISAAVAGTDYVTPTGTETLTNKTIAFASNTLTDVAGTTATQTLTNKRIDPRVSSAGFVPTNLTPSIATADQYAYTALASALTINAPTGTPVNGNKLIFRILDNGTAQTLTWNATYTAIGVTLPTTTVANKTTYVGCIYNAHNARWDVIAVTTQA
jgi:hypothetical protein